MSAGFPANGMAMRSANERRLMQPSRSFIPRARAPLVVAILKISRGRSEGWLTAVRMGIGMMPRGEGALIVARVGLQSQIVTQSTYAIVVFMTAVTTLLAPPLLAIIYAFKKKQLPPSPSPN